MKYFSKNKKWMAYLILLTFVFTCIVPTNLAGGNSAWADTATDNKQQIVESQTDTTQTPPEPVVETSDDGFVKVKKYLEPTDDENCFDITLEVEAKEENKEADTDAAVVLVLDTSASMQLDVNGQGYCPSTDSTHITTKHVSSGYSATVNNQTYNYIDGYTCADWTNVWALATNDVNEDKQSRFWRASESMQSFLNSFNSPTANRKVAVVTFGNVGSTDLGWIDLNSNLSTVKNAVSFATITGRSTNDGYPGNVIGTTNTHGYTGKIQGQTAQGKGLEEAYGLITSPDISNIQNKYVILLTDGRPEGEHLTTDLNDSTKKYANQSGEAGTYMVEQLESQGATVFVVAFGTETLTMYDTTYYEKVNDWLKSLATDAAKNFFPIGNGDSLNTAFEQITKSINTKKANVGMVTDPMGSGVEFVSFIGDSNGATVNNGEIEWDLSNVTVTPTESGNIKTYKYTLKYRVRLKTEKSGFVEGGTVTTNGNAVVNYTITDKGQTSNPTQVSFPVPSVKGYLGELSFTKVDSFTNELVDGATFTLAHASDCTVCTSAGIDDIQISMTATSGANGIKGQVDFANIPSGHKYTLTETVAPAGYALNGNTYEVTVSYGVLTSDIPKDSQDNLYITNDRTGKITVEGTKTWVDGSNKDNTRPDAITLNLYRYTTDENSKEQVAGVTPTWTKSGNVWRYQFAGLDQYVKINDRQYEYTYVVEEVPINGYEEPVYSGDKNYDITNTLSQKYITVEGEKIWEDGNKNHDGSKPITLELFRDGRFIATTETALDWSYSFGELPKYALKDADLADGEKADGHVFEYQVREQVIPAGYIPDYDVEVKANGDYYITITNNVRDEKTPINILGKKIWTDGNDKHNAETEKVKIQLFRSDMTEAWKTTEMALDWTYSFTDLPKYNDNNEWITYTVKEVPIDGYISAVVPTSEGFDIVNTPYVENQGQIAVGKVVTAEDGATPPPAGTEFEFLLKIKAELDQREFDKTVAKEEAALKEAYDKAVSARDRAAIALNGSDEDPTSGAVNAFKTSAYLTTESQYQFIMVDDKASPIFAAKTSPSAYVYNVMGETADKLDNADEDVLKKAVDSVLDVIKDLANSFSSLYNTPSFLHQLAASPVESTSPSALAFGITETDNLLKAHNAYNAANRLVADTEKAWKEYKVTTPTAIKVFWKDGNDVTEIKKDIADLVDGWYHIGFKLLDKEVNSFEVEATTGSMITFSVTETGYAQADATEITVKDGDVTEKTISGRFTDLWNLTTESAYGFTFNNIYKTQGGGGEIPTTINRSVEKVWNDNNNPNRPGSIKVNLLRNGEVVETVTLSAANGWDYNWYNLDASYIWSVQEVDVADGYTASVSRSGTTFIITNTLTTTSTIPDETIPDENVPTGSVEPGVPLDEPEIPLGDAPATGDTNNAAPFMALMLFAVAGLVITRRKFN